MFNIFFLRRDQSGEFVCQGREFSVISSIEIKTKLAITCEVDILLILYF
jgi:hypothetical protein